MRRAANRRPNEARSSPRKAMPERRSRIDSALQIGQYGSPPIPTMQSGQKAPMHLEQQANRSSTNGWFLQGMASW